MSIPINGANGPVTRTWYRPGGSCPFALETARRCQRGAQIMTGIRSFVGRHLFGWAAGNDAPAVIAALGPQVHHPVRGLDDIEIVLDHDDRIALIAQALQHYEQLRDIGEMQTRGRLIENV